MKRGRVEDEETAEGCNLCYRAVVFGDSRLKNAQGPYKAITELMRLAEKVSRKSGSCRA